MKKKIAVGHSKETAFEVIHNGRLIGVGGIQGRRGVISTAIDSVRGEDGLEALRLNLSGLDSEADEHIWWIRKSLQMGDEVVVRLVDRVKTSRVLERQKRQVPKTKAISWIRELAKQHGYKLVKIKK